MVNVAKRLSQTVFFLIALLIFFYACWLAYALPPTEPFDLQLLIEGVP